MRGVPFTRGSEYILSAMPLNQLQSWKINRTNTMRTATRSVFLLILSATALGITSCGESGPMKVEEITIAPDKEGSPGDATERLKPNDNPFHAVIQLNQSGGGVVVKMELTAVETAEGNDVSVVTESKELGGINNQADFTISLPRPWPTGKYRVDAYLNDSLAQSKEFQVAE